MIALGDQVLLSSLKQIFLLDVLGKSTGKDSSQSDHLDTGGGRTAGIVLGTRKHLISRFLYGLQLWLQFFMGTNYLMAALLC